VTPDTLRLKPPYAGLKGKPGVERKNERNETVATLDFSSRSGVAFHLTLRLPVAGPPIKRTLQSFDVPDSVPDTSPDSIVTAGPPTLGVAVQPASEAETVPVREVAVPGLVKAGANLIFPMTLSQWTVYLEASS